MITVVDPLQPTVTMSWFVQQEDQHRRPVPATPGIVGVQSRLDWLSLLSVAVRVVVRTIKRWVVISLSPMLATVVWLQERAAVHRDSYSELSLFLGGSSTQ